MCAQQLGWELGRCSAMVIFPLWASIPSSAMETHVPTSVELLGVGSLRVMTQRGAGEATG